MGLQGMINYMMKACDFPTVDGLDNEPEELAKGDYRSIARMITMVERAVTDKNFRRDHERILQELKNNPTFSAPVVGLTGTGGAGKSSLTDEWVRRFLADFPDKKIAVLSIDPSKQRSGGALLGDRIRMNAVHHPRVFMRSLATRRNRSELSAGIQDAIAIVKRAGFDLILVETSGIGQGDADIVQVADLSVYVMTSEFGAPSQLEKIEMLDYADLIAINKFDRKGSEDALRDVRKQYRRNHNLFDVPDEALPVYGTMASRFNDAGTDQFYRAVIDRLREKTGWEQESSLDVQRRKMEVRHIIPPERTHYLWEIANTVRKYQSHIEEQSLAARRLYQLEGVRKMLEESRKKPLMKKTLEVHCPIWRRNGPHDWIQTATAC